MIRVRIPATSANLGAGFDCLGLSLMLYNKIWLEESDRLEIKARDGQSIPLDENNLVYQAARKLFNVCGKELRGLHIEQENVIPIERGLGSSSACIVGGLVGANFMLGSPLQKQDLIHLAFEIEGHPDNTTPAIVGGMVVSAVEDKKVYYVSVPVFSRVRFAVLIPPFHVRTSIAREHLRDHFTREDVVYNLSRASLLTASIFSGNLENLKVGVQDRLHQEERIQLIEKGRTVMSICYELGTYGTYISGAGPTIISILDRKSSESFKQKICKRFQEEQIEGWKVKILRADSFGATVHEE